MAVRMRVIGSICSFPLLRKPRQGVYHLNQHYLIRVPPFSRWLLLVLHKLRRRRLPQANYLSIPQDRRKSSFPAVVCSTVSRVYARRESIKIQLSAKNNSGECFSIGLFYRISGYSVLYTSTHGRPYCFLLLRKCDPRRKT